MFSTLLSLVVLTMLSTANGQGCDGTWSKWDYTTSIEAGESIRNQCNANGYGSGPGCQTTLGIYVSDYNADDILEVRVSDGDGCANILETYYNYYPVSWMNSNLTVSGKTYDGQFAQRFCVDVKCANTASPCDTVGFSTYMECQAPKKSGSCTANSHCESGVCKDGSCCTAGGLSDGCTECWSGLGTCKTCAAPYVLDPVTQSCKVPKYGSCTANSMCESGSCKGGNCCAAGGLSVDCTECKSYDGQCKVCSAPYSLSPYSGMCELSSPPPPSPSPPPPPSPSPLPPLYTSTLRVSSSATMLSTTAAALIGFSYVVAALTLE
mmetsp:Transcript_34480/g.55386  ORF Transcript_34480/g.55386 Transcript_34480/m.55386 type:complete len:322 (-) Transcript_34480:331-1296(-)